MRIPKGAALIRGRCLFESRRLLEELNKYGNYGIKYGNCPCVGVCHETI